MPADGAGLWCTFFLFCHQVPSPALRQYGACRRVVALVRATRYGGTQSRCFRLRYALRQYGAALVRCYGTAAEPCPLRLSKKKLPPLSATADGNVLRVHACLGIPKESTLSDLYLTPSTRLRAHCAPTTF